MTARETTWVKAVPSAIAEGFTGGRSDAKVTDRTKVLGYGATHISGIGKFGLSSKLGGTQIRDLQ